MHDVELSRREGILEGTTIVGMAGRAAPRQERSWVFAEEGTINKSDYK